MRSSILPLYWRPLVAIKLGIQEQNWALTLFVALDLPSLDRSFRGRRRWTQLRLSVLSPVDSFPSKPTWPFGIATLHVALYRGRRHGVQAVRDVRHQSHARALTRQWHQILGQQLTPSTCFGSRHLHIPIVWTEMPAVEMASSRKTYHTGSRRPGNTRDSGPGNGGDNVGRISSKRPRVVSKRLRAVPERSLPPLDRLSFILECPPWLPHLTADAG